MRVFLYADEKALPEGELALIRVLERQISCFADMESSDGLLRHAWDSSWRLVLETLRDGFSDYNLCEPFVWSNMEPFNLDSRT